MLDGRKAPNWSSNTPFTLGSKNTWMTTAFHARYPLSFTGCLSVHDSKRLAQFFDDDGNPIDGGCHFGSRCRYIHPSNSIWKTMVPHKVSIFLPVMIQCTHYYSRVATLKVTSKTGRQVGGTILLRAEPRELTTKENIRVKKEKQGILES